MQITEHSTVMQQKRNGRPWTYDEDAMLITLHRNGLNDLEIAAEMDRAPGVVSKHRRMLGICANIAPPKPSGPSEKSLPIWKVYEMTGSKPSAIEQASAELGLRLVSRVIRGESVWELDGRIGATVQQIIAAANKLREQADKPLLGRIRP